MIASIPANLTAVAADVAGVRPDFSAVGAQLAMFTPVDSPRSFCCRRSHEGQH
jgi:hypothetical protein